MDHEDGTNMKKIKGTLMPKIERDVGDSLV